MTAKQTLTRILIFTMISSNAFAALSGSITLTGHVNSATSITVTPQNNYNALDLTVNTTDLVVAAVREKNNTAAGYTVTLASANSGKLKNGAVGEVTYSGKYNGSAVTLSSTPQNVTTQGAQTGIVNVVKNFSITYTGTPEADLMVGDYTDTLTFTIAAN